MANSHGSGPFLSRNGFGTNIDAQTGNTVSTTAASVVVTSAALTTVAGASQNIVVNNPNAAVGDVAIASVVGGTNTVKGVSVARVVVTADVITVTLDNNNASAPLNGTVSLAVTLIKQYN